MLIIKKNNIELKKIKWKFQAMIDVNLSFKNIKVFSIKIGK